MSRPLRLLPASLALLPLLFFHQPVDAQSPGWAGFRGPTGDGRLLGGLPTGDGSLALEVRWQRPFGSGYAGISVAEGLAVTACAAGERDIVVALDPLTGEERWRADLDRTYTGHDGSHDGPIATPAISEGRVFTLSPWGRVVALDVKSGELLWSVHLVDDFGSTKPLYGYGTSPVVFEDLVVIQGGGEGGSVIALDAASGEVRWRSFEDGIYSQSPILTELAGRRQLVVMGAEKIAGLEPRDGSVLWSHPHGGSGIFGRDTSSPLPVGDGRLFVKHDSTRSSVVRVTEGEAGLAVETLGENRTMTRSYSPPTVWGEQVYGFTSRFLGVLDLETGEQLWRSREPGDGFPIVIEGQLIILTKEGTLHIGPASPEGWSETDSLELFDDLAWTPPSYAGGALYVRSLSGIARVDVVRRQAFEVTDAEPVPPPVLQAVAREAAEAEDPAAVVDAFLHGRELPIVDGETVLFLWRGEASDVAVAGALTGARFEEPMHRLEGTDLWWWDGPADPRGRFSYVFFVDYEPTVDPSHDRRIEATILGPDMNWRRDEALVMSWFAMPDWPGRKAPVRVAPAISGTIDSFEVPLAAVEQEEDEARIGTVRVWLPPGYADSAERYPTVYVLDDYAREVGGWPEALDRVVGSEVEPLIAVFVEEPPRTGGEAYYGWLEDDVIPAVDGRYRTRAERSERAVIGNGWYGVDSLLLAFSEEGPFGRLAVQSPLTPSDNDVAAVREAVASIPVDKRPTPLYYEWGYWELRSPNEGWDVGKESGQIYDILRSAGVGLVGGEVWDTTDWASWRNRTDLLLRALFPSQEGAEPEDLAEWLTGSP